MATDPDGPAGGPAVIAKLSTARRPARLEESLLESSQVFAEVQECVEGREVCDQCWWSGSGTETSLS